MKKEIYQLLRDPRTLFIAFFAPSVLLILLGYGVTTDVKDIPMIVINYDKKPSSNDFIDKFINSNYFRVVEYSLFQSDIDYFLESNLVKLAVVIPPDFSEKIQKREATKVQIILDGSDSSTANVTIGYVRGIFNEYLRELLNENYRQLSGKFELLIDYRPRVYYNPELISTKFLIPGLICVIMMMITVILTALTISKERERGTIEQLMVTPVGASQIIIGKVLPYGIIAFIEVVLTLIAGYFFFDLTIKGNILLLAIITLVFLFCGLGLGIFVSTITDSQQLAMFIAFIIGMLPTFLLSGFVFPIRNMPVILQWISNIIPAKYYLVVLRGIILKGVGMEAFYMQVVYLLIFMIIILGIASLRLKKVLFRMS